MKKVFLVALILSGGVAIAQSNKVRTGNLPTPAEKVEPAKVLTDTQEDEGIEENIDETPRQTAEERGKMQAERLRKKLGLSDTQYERVVVMTTSRAKQLDELRAKYGKDRQGMGREVAEIQNNFNTTLKQVLDQNQWSKYQEILEKRRARLQQRTHQK